MLHDHQVIEIIANNPPVIAVGATVASPGSIDRVGANTTEISVPFSDADQPGVRAAIEHRVDHPGHCCRLAAGQHQCPGGGEAIEWRPQPVHR